VVSLMMSKGEKEHQNLRFVFLETTSYLWKSTRTYLSMKTCELGPTDEKDRENSARECWEIKYSETCSVASPCNAIVEFSASNDVKELNVGVEGRVQQSVLVRFTFTIIISHNHDHLEESYLARKLDCLGIP